MMIIILILFLLNSGKFMTLMLRTYKSRWAFWNDSGIKSNCWIFHCHTCRWFQHCFLLLLLGHPNGFLFLFIRRKSKRKKVGKHKRSRKMRIKRKSWCKLKCRLVTTSLSSRPRRYRFLASSEWWNVHHMLPLNLHMSRVHLILITCTSIWAKRLHCVVQTCSSRGTNRCTTLCIWKSFVAW